MKLLSRACLAIAFDVLFLTSVSVASRCQTVSVSVPILHTASNERIVGFEIHIRSGRIAKLPNVPIGWSISVDNDPSWNTTIKGSIAVGAAAVDPDFLRGFVVVEIEKNPPSDVPFDLQGVVIVTSDFSTERRIKLSMKDFATKDAGTTKVEVQH